VFLWFLPFLLAAAVPVFAQPVMIEANANQTDPESKYRFLDALPHPAKELSGPGFKATAEAKSDLNIFPIESDEEKKLRKKLTTLLKLAEGDSVMITPGTYVKFVAVPNGQFPEEGNRYTPEVIQSTQKWLSEFIEDPDTAIHEYGMNSHVDYESRDGEAYAYYYIYFPEDLLREIRKDRVSLYRRLVMERGEKPEEVPEGPGNIKGTRYYYEDGTPRKEEIYRNGKLMIARKFNPKGELVDEIYNWPGGRG